MNWTPQPTVKAPELESAITAITGIDRREAVASKRCAMCGNAVLLTSFKDSLSLKEFHISAMCQYCQDDFYG
jgi:hypothetical protein